MLKIRIFRYVTPVYRYIVNIDNIYLIAVHQSTLRDTEDDKYHIITYRRLRFLAAVVYITLPAVAVIRKIFGIISIAISLAISKLHDNKEALYRLPITK
jgi:hypothetical protein